MGENNVKMLSAINSTSITQNSLKSPKKRKETKIWQTNKTLYLSPATKAARKP